MSESIKKLLKLSEKLGEDRRLCEICERRESTRTCRLCDRAVCDYCFSHDKEICIVCRESLCDECENAIAVDVCVICGKNICRRCSYELDYARRICLTCLRRTGDPRRYVAAESKRAAEMIAEHWRKVREKNSDINIR